MAHALRPRSEHNPKDSAFWPFLTVATISAVIIGGVVLYSRKVKAPEPAPAPQG